MTTIFKSGKNPGEFTRVISTVYFDEKRKRDTDSIVKQQQHSKIVDINDFSSDSFEDLDLDNLQSGLNF